MSRRGNDSPFDSDGRPGAVDERIADWVDGRLDAIQLQRFEAELRVNPALRAEAEEYRRSVEAIREALAGGERVREGFADHVMAAIEGERHARRRRWIPWVGSAAAAAALIGLWLALSRGVILPNSRHDLARAPSASPSADGPAAPRGELRDQQQDGSAGAGGRGGLEILPGTFFGESVARGRTDSEALESFERAGEPATRTTDEATKPVGAEDGSKNGRAERPFAGGERYAARDSVALDEERSVNLGRQTEDARRGFRGGLVAENEAAESEAERLQAGAPPSATRAALDAGQLVYLVEIPAEALDRLSLAWPDAKLLVEGLQGREREGEVPAATAVQSLSTAQAFAAYRLAIQPLQATTTWTGNVTMPRLFALDLAPPAAATLPSGGQESIQPGTADQQDSGRYSFMPGDLVFEIGGDDAQVQDYLRYLAKPVREVAGNIAVQRAVDVVARERIAVPTDPTQQSAADEMFLGFLKRGADPVEESFADSTRRVADRGDQPLGRPGRGAAPKAARTGPSSPGPGGPGTPLPDPAVPAPASQPVGGSRVQNSWVVLRAKPSAPAGEAGPAQRR
jgi:hypothetical protein